jgi:hypothetical protein
VRTNDGIELNGNDMEQEHLQFNSQFLEIKLLLLLFYDYIIKIQNTIK